VIRAITGFVPVHPDLLDRKEHFVIGHSNPCLAPGSLMLTDPAVILYEQLKETKTHESGLYVLGAINLRIKKKPPW